MSRSGYTEDCDGNYNLYRGSVARALSGKRGQSFLREMATALDAMPVKELVAGEIVRDSEHVCAMGSVAVARKLDVSDLDVEDAYFIAKRFGIAESMAREIAYHNDEGGVKNETPALRWKRMREWIDAQLRVGQSHE
jgi:hypothetical protein